MFDGYEGAAMRRKRTDPRVEQAENRLIGDLDRVREDGLEALESLRQIEDAVAAGLDQRVVDEWSFLHDLGFADEAATLRADVDADPTVARHWAAGAHAVTDDLRRLTDDLERLTLVMRGGDIDVARRHVNAIVQRCAELVVPMKINDRIEGYRVGKPLDFEAEFAHDIPDPVMRRSVLDYVLRQQGRIHGIVDERTGQIYKQSPSAVYRMFTYLSPLLLTAASIGALLLIAHLELPSSWGITSDAHLISLFALVGVGTAMHLLVESAKQYQLDNIRITPITNGLDWLHLRWVGVAQTFLWMIVVVIGLALLDVDPTEKSQISLCLAAGFSLDSTAGLFITRFQQLAGSGRVVLERRVGADATAIATTRPLAD